MAIPFSFLVSWAKSHRDEDKSLTYVSTLEKKNMFQSVEEIIASTDSGKKISDLRAFLTSKYDELLNESGARGSLPTSASPIVLGKTSSDASFYERLKAFIKDYLEVRLASSQDTTKRVFKESFVPLLFHMDVPTDENLGEQLACSGQTIRNHRNLCVNECQTLLLEGKPLSNYLAEPSLAQEVLAFKSDFERIISHETACRLTEIKEDDERTFNFLLKLFNLDMSKDEDVKIRAILPNRSTGPFQRKIGQVIKYFRDDVVCLRFNEDIVPGLKRITDNPELVEVFKSLILNSDEFVHYNVAGQDYIALRWDLLKSLAPRVCWIVFEQKAFDLKSAVSSDRIVTLYNSKDYAGEYKASRITREEIRSSQLGRCWRLMNIGRQGYWIIRKSRSEDFDISEFSASLQTPDMTYAQYIQAAKDSGLMPVYPETTVANYFTGNKGPCQRYDWGPKMNDVEAVIRKNNAPLKANAIVVGLYHKYQFTSSFKNISAAFLQKIHNEPSRFITQSGDSPRDGIWIGLPGMVFPESYRTIIKNKAVELLLKKEAYTMDQDELYRIFGPYVPEDLVEASALASIFGDQEFFFRNGGGKKGNHITITLNPLRIP